MKVVLAFISLLVFSGCGIMSLVFGLPERYITRDLKTDELAGVWKITPKSQTTLDAFVKKFPDWGVMVPLKAITMNSDTTCQVKVEEKWLIGKAAKDKKPCSWQLSKADGYNNKQVAVIALNFEEPDGHTSGYSLFIAEENGNLILWNIIGDPDDFITEDFIKTDK